MKMNLAGQAIELPELNFDAASKLECMGVDLLRTNLANIGYFTLCKAVVALAVGAPETAAELLETEILDKGVDRLAEIYQTCIEYIGNSDFFTRLLKTEEEKKAKK